MRTWGRVAGSSTWQEITTDSNGLNDAVMVTTLCQCLKLNINESPFWANYGINAQQSVVTSVFPDFYVNQTQAQFSGYFASLIISKTTSPVPVYNVAITLHNGAKINTQVAQ
jgi:hypothetical protein